MQYGSIVVAVKCYVNSFYFVLCQLLCLVVMREKCLLLSFVEEKEEEPGM